MWIVNCGPGVVAAATVLGFAVEILARHLAAPAALLTDPVAHQLVVGKELRARLRVGFGHVARRMHADR